VPPLSGSDPASEKRIRNPQKASPWKLSDPSGSAVYSNGQGSRQKPRTF
jgi:hypothetical protein